MGVRFVWVRRTSGEGLTVIRSHRRGCLYRSPPRGLVVFRVWEAVVTLFHAEMGWGHSVQGKEWSREFQETGR